MQDLRAFEALPAECYLDEVREIKDHGRHSNGLESELPGVRIIRGC